jgi:hypothetical protein
MYRKINRAGKVLDSHGSEDLPRFDQRHAAEP